MFNLLTWNGSIIARTTVADPSLGGMPSFYDKFLQERGGGHGPRGPPPLVPLLSQKLKLLILIFFVRPNHPLIA